MGIWIELGVFLIALAFGFWQLYDVRQARIERESREARPPGDEAAPNPPAR